MSQNIAGSTTSIEVTALERMTLQKTIARWTLMNPDLAKDTPIRSVSEGIILQKLLARLTLSQMCPSEPVSVVAEKETLSSPRKRGRPVGSKDSEETRERKRIAQQARYRQSDAGGGSYSTALR